MTNLSLYGRTAVLAAAFCSLVAAGASDAQARSLVAATAAESPPDLSPAPDPQPAPPGDQPDPNELYIEEIKTGGPGCKTPDTVTTQISDDKKSFLIMYDDMELTNPGGAKVKTLNCSAGVKLHVPGGWQVALATVNTRGYVYLENKIRARQTSNYFFAGKKLGAYAHTELKGPYDDFYVFSDEIPFESLVWSACGTSAIFSINTTLNLNASANPKGEAIFNTNTTDGMFQTLLLWQFRKC